MVFENVFIDDVVITKNCSNAEFTVTGGGCVGETIQFTSELEIGGTSHLWDFW